MYIEKLTNKDFQKFASLFNCSVSEAKNTNNNELYLRLFTGAMGPQPEMWISDFNLTASTYYKHAETNLKNKYVHFMNDKFGKKYQEDYTNNYDNQIEKNRII